jgi:hypothetical protein
MAYHEHTEAPKSRQGQGQSCHLYKPFRRSASEGTSPGRERQPLTLKLPGVAYPFSHQSAGRGLTSIGPEHFAMIAITNTARPTTCSVRTIALCACGLDRSNFSLPAMSRYGTGRSSNKQSTSIILKSGIEGGNSNRESHQNALNHIPALIPGGRLNLPSSLYFQVVREGGLEPPSHMAALFY